MNSAILNNAILTAERQLIQLYFKENPELLSGMSLLMGQWDCKENASGTDVLEQTEDEWVENIPDFQFDFDHVVFYELMEEMEEMIVSLLLKLVCSQAFIQASIEIKGQPVAVDSFIQLQKKVRQYMDENRLKEMGSLSRVVGF